MNYHYEIHVSVIITTQVHFWFFVRVMVIRAQHITHHLSDLVTFSFTLIFLQSSESREISPLKKLVTSWGVNREGDIS